MVAFSEREDASAIFHNVNMKTWNFYDSVQRLTQLIKHEDALWKGGGGGVGVTLCLCSNSFKHDWLIIQDGDQQTATRRRKQEKIFLARKKNKGLGITMKI